MIFPSLAEWIWFFWAVAGIILCIAEIFTPGFYVILLGLAAILTAVLHFIISLSSLELIWLLGIDFTVFAALSILGFIFIRPFMLNFAAKNSHKIRSNRDALIGRKTMVIQASEGMEKPAYVKIDGDYWAAERDDSKPLIKGDSVIVKEIKGNHLIVSLEK